MDTREIDDTLRRDPYTSPLYGGTFALDLLPNPLPPGRLYVVNLDRSDEEGSHWCQASTLFSPWCTTYFDSFGRPPPKEILPALSSPGGFVSYSDIAIQSPLSQACGYHVLLVCMLQARGYSLREILFQFYRSDEDEYLRNDAYARSLISSLTSLRERPLIDWNEYWQK